MISVAALIASVAGASVEGAERWEGLRAMSHVAVDVVLSPSHPDIPTEALRRRVEDALRQMQPAPAIEPSSVDRLRLVVAVRSYSSSDLRGYYLPLSQSYGIGPVRLSVERPATVGGLPAPIAATVWQAERQATAPWRRSADEILALVDELLAVFLADYRRALGP